MRKRTMIAVLSGVVLAGGLLTSPASAATDGNCGGSEICLYYGYSLGTPVYDTGGGLNTYVGKTFYGSSFALNDNVASAKSRAIWQECRIYEHANLSGTMYPVSAGSTVNNLGILANEGSSHYWW